MARLIWCVQCGHVVTYNSNVSYMSIIKYYMIGKSLPINDAVIIDTIAITHLWLFLICPITQNGSAQEVNDRFYE